jgi:O-antigen ligase
VAWRLGQFGAVAWGLAAAAAAAATGVLLTASPDTTQNVALAIGASALVAWRPLYALIAVLVLCAVLPNNVTLKALALVGIGIAVLLWRPRVPGRVVVPLGALLLIALTTVPVDPSPDDGVPVRLVLPGIGLETSQPFSLELAEWFQLAAVLATLCLAAWAVRDRAQLRAVMLAIMVSALYPIGKGLEQWATGDLTVRTGVDQSLAAVRGPFEFPNSFGFYLLCVLAVSIVAFLEVRSLWARLACGAYLCLATLLLLLTYTRSAWIGAAVMVLVFGLLGHRRLLAAGALALALAAFAYPTATDRVQERFADLSSSQAASDSSSWNWRTTQWERMVPRGREQPVFGHGFGSYREQSIEEFGLIDPHYSVVDFRDEAGPRGLAAHNDYVRLFVETGIVGLALWVLTLTGLATVAARARRVPAARLAGAATVALTVALAAVSAADNIAGDPVVLMVAGALVGGTWGVAQGARRAED